MYFLVESSFNSNESLYFPDSQWIDAQNAGCDLLWQTSRRHSIIGRGLMTSELDRRQSESEFARVFLSQQLNGVIRSLVIKQFGIYGLLHYNTVCVLFMNCQNCPQWHIIITCPQWHIIITCPQWHIIITCPQWHIIITSIMADTGPHSGVLMNIT